jgi:nucleotide-binding universal stress UspA family protein
VTARSLLVAYDFSPPSARALEWARLLHARLHAAVTLLHVDVDPLDQSALHADASTWETPEQRDRRLRWLKDELSSVANESFGPDAQTVRIVAVRGRPVDRLIELALERDIDLVVVGASGKGAVDRVLLGSTTQELVRRCPIPVLTVH